MSSVQINVLISDGRKLMREALTMLLEKHEHIHVVGEAEDARSAAKLIGPLGAHAVLLLLPSGYGSGAGSAPSLESNAAVATVREIVVAEPSVKLIVLTHGLSAPALKNVVRAGACGCLSMDCTSNELVLALDQAASGGDIYLGSRLHEQLARRYVKSVSITPPPPEARLAIRETEVLRLIATGHSTKEIASLLKVGMKTVETHRRRIMDKLGRYSVAELTQYAILKGLIDLPHHAEI